KISTSNEIVTHSLHDALPILDAQIAGDEGRFDLIDVVEQIADKMVRRHPHVFGDARAETTHDVRTHWERAKGDEKQHRESVLDRSEEHTSELQSRENLECRLL